MKISMDDIRFMHALEKISGVSAKDCLVTGDLISFLVKGKDVGKAIGRKAVNVKELERNLGKRIEIIGYGENPEEMVEAALDVKATSVSNKNGRLAIMLDGPNKKKVYGNIGRIKRLQELLVRNYQLELVIQ